MIENLREILIDKYDVKNSAVDSLIEQVKGFSPKLTTAFENWVKTGETDETEVEGYTVKSFIEKHPTSIPSAYGMLSWLEREPENAKKALRLDQTIKNSAAQKDWHK